MVTYIRNVLKFCIINSGKYICVYLQLNIKTVLFQTVQFSISTQFSSIWPIVMTISGATTLDQSGPRINGNGRVRFILQNSRITGTSPSDCLVLYRGHSLVWVLPSAAKKSVYFTTPTDWANFTYAFCGNDDLRNFKKLFYLYLLKLYSDFLFSEPVAKSGFQRHQSDSKSS